MSQLVETFNFNSAVLMTASVLVVAFVWTYLRASSKWKMIDLVNEKHRVLLITAHPDDECMFFGPTIQKLSKIDGVRLYLMCLSVGDYEGQGQVRKTELYKSCEILGINEGNIVLCKNSQFLDDPNAYWETSILSDKIAEHVEQLDINIILTFDNYGVSGHRNHVSIYMAIIHLMCHNMLPSYCRSYTLDSVNIVRKYVKCIDRLFSRTSDMKYILTAAEQDCVNRAMQAHTSQYIWFRKLYMQFSRYKIINTYTAISAEC
ncbi:N-acetylglucosaminyl-phosphatidylinositol de-N-acetylase [Adelges cooleyi]|uniref:N-acetylglucosaminyl-phosphatidylinositol de-N-acetylase n=1 Tax=Adelges cooleyi TaxID=133065 RepID=UPI0021801025|nr:N-acetylglucosaminyl-phosphatidylinositol de-N-acetylase [Adelges cooleyi]